MIAKTLLLLVWLLGASLAQAGILCTTDDMVSRGDHAALDLTGSFSMTAWIKPLNTYGAGSRGRILDKQSANQGYLFALHSPTAEQGLAVGVNTISTTDTLAFAATTITLGNVYHVAATFDATTQAALVYVDGTARSTQITTLATDPIANTIALALCRRGATAANGFDGVLDDVRLYDRVLAAADIKNMASSRLRTPPMGGTPVAAWPLNDCVSGQTPTGAGFFQDRGPSRLHATPLDGTGLTCHGTHISLIQTGVW